MWEIKNKTPFKADGCFARDKDWTEYWVVAVKACFSYADTSVPFLKISPKQTEIKGLLKVLLLIKNYQRSA